jgi:hypothetical protein
MKVEHAVKILPDWKIAEFIDRLEDRRVKKQDENTKEGAKATAGFNLGLPGLGGIRGSLAGVNLLTANRFFKERFTKKGREARIERKLTDQANKGKVDTEVLIKELDRRMIRYRSPVMTVGDYRHARIVDGVPKPMRNIVIRDYDLDQDGKVRPFIQELLQTECIQRIEVDTDKDVVFTVPINAFDLKAKGGVKIDTDARAVRLDTPRSYMGSDWSNLPRTLHLMYASIAGTLDVKSADIRNASVGGLKAGVVCNDQIIVYGDASVQDWEVGSATVAGNVRSWSLLSVAKDITILGKLDALGRLTIDSNESCQAKIDVSGETWIESYTKGYRAGKVNQIAASPPAARRKNAQTGGRRPL